MAAALATDYSDPSEIHHLVLKISGSKEKQAFFNYALWDCDGDWPLGPEKKAETCMVCGGVTYKLPYFNTKQIKTLAKQVNEMASLPGHLKVKVRKFAKATTCLGKLKKSLAV
jgi:hypothetical protein